MPLSLYARYEVLFSFFIDDHHIGNLTFSLALLLSLARILRQV